MEILIYICYEIGFLQAVSNEYLSKHNKMHWSLLENCFCCLFFISSNLLDLQED